MSKTGLGLGLSSIRICTSGGCVAMVKSSKDTGYAKV